MMPLKPSKLFLVTLFMFSLAHANENSILSQERLNIFNYQQQQNEEESSKLRKDWINPIIYKYAHDFAENDVDSKKSYISINQPIFKSGGIFNAVIYANQLEKYNNLDIELRQKTMIKDATSLLFQIHKANYTIQKQSLLLQNAKIDIDRKKEQVLNGFLDTSFLDEAILEANTRKNTLAELKYTKFELIQNFNNLSSKEYTAFELPKLELINQEEFVGNNLEILKQQRNIKVKDKFYWMTVAKYLPTFNFTYDYTKYHEIKNSSVYSDGDNNEQYGFNVTIPLDVRIKNDIQSNKLAYLIAKNSLQTTILEQENMFKSAVAKINMLDEKINIAKEDYLLYNSLLEVITQEYNAQLKTKSDVDTLANSQEMKLLDSKIFEIERQIELLELYSKLHTND